jgi:hypothetical protein
MRVWTWGGNQSRKAGIRAGKEGQNWLWKLRADFPELDFIRERKKKEL